MLRIAKKQGGARKLLTYRLIGKNRFSSAASQHIAFYAAQFLGILLVSPQKNAGWTCPKSVERSLSLKNVGRIRKFRPIPQVPARLVQNPQGNASIEIQGRGLVVLAVHHNDVSWLMMTLDGHGERLRREDRRESHKSRVHAGEQPDHHQGQRKVAPHGVSAFSQKPVQSCSQQQ